MPKFSNTYEFINKAKLIHNNRYDYSLVEYIDCCKTTVKIECSVHGIFEQYPTYHLSGNGCAKCQGFYKTNDEIINEFKQIHKDRYDYSLIDYKNTKDKVKIICKEHGIFEQVPNSHLNGNGCPKCYGRNKTNEDIINDFKKIHGDKYDYSLVKYINAITKVIIICKEHGNFELTPNAHLSGGKCSKCSKVYRPTTEEFIKKANQIHLNKYNYSKTNYINNSTKIVIICPEHGEFLQTPAKHIDRMQGCLKCSQSKGELKIRQFLERSNIEYITEKKFDGCKAKKSLKFDFYLPEYNTCVEFDGGQHFRVIKRFGGEEEFKKRQKYDEIKNKFCLKENINLIRIKFDENIEEKLTSKLNKK